MTANEFAAAAERSRLTATGIAMARRHLLQGEPQASIAAAFGVTQGRVSQACRSIRRAAGLADLRMVAVTVEVPAGAVGKLRAAALALRDAALRERKGL